MQAVFIAGSTCPVIDMKKEPGQGLFSVCLPGKN